MKYKFFKISTRDPVESETDVNNFCSQHRIIDVEKNFVADGEKSFWTVCITYSDNEGSFASSIKRKNKVDYKDVLNEEDFNLYSQLRDLRKKLAERDGTPAYNIFTNEQLANIVQQRVISKTALQALDGIGSTRLEKYGENFIQCMKTIIQ